MESPVLLPHKGLVLQAYGSEGILQFQWVSSETINKYYAWVAELVDARDLKSLVTSGRAGSIPAPGTSNFKGLSIIV